MSKRVRCAGQASCLLATVLLLHGIVVLNFSLRFTLFAIVVALFRLFLLFHIFLGFFSLEFTDSFLLFRLLMFDLFTIARYLILLFGLHTLRLDFLFLLLFLAFFAILIGVTLVTLLNFRAVIFGVVAAAPLVLFDIADHIIALMFHALERV